MLLTKDEVFQLIDQQGEDIVVPDVYTSIGSHAFSEDSIAEYGLSRGIFSPNELNFHYQFALKSVVIPEVVTSIGDYAFSGASLSNFKLPESLEFIGKYAFQGFWRADSHWVGKSLTIPKKVKQIPTGAFLSSDFDSVVLPDGLISIGSSAFEFSSLLSVSLPSSLRSIGERAFRGVSLKAMGVDLHPDTQFEKNSFEPNIVVNIKEPPRDLAISETSFDENIRRGSVVASISSEINHGDNSLVYSLAEGDGDNDNVSFKIAGNSLAIRESPDYEQKPIYLIRIAATASGLRSEKLFVLSVKDLVESESANDLSGMSQLIGSAANDKLKGKKASAEIYGLAGKDKLIGSSKDDLLDGGPGNDILKGRKGGDIYVLSDGNDRFKGLRLSEGDVVRIDSGIEFDILNAAQGSQIAHENGVTIVFGVGPEGLSELIETA